MLVINWLDHLLFCTPVVLVVSPALVFRDLLTEFLPGCYSQHPDWAKVDMAKAVWELDGKPFTPTLDKTLAEQGIGHKSMLRFETPGLKGIKGISY